MAADAREKGVPQDPGRGRARLRVALLIAVIAAVAAVAVILVASSEGGASGVPAGDAAIVRDAPSGDVDITEAEIEDWIARYSRAIEAEGGKEPKRGSKRYGDFQEVALEALLQAVVIRGQAAEEGIGVTPSQLKRGVAQYERTHSPTAEAHEGSLETTDRTQGELNDEVEVQILGAKLEENATAEVPDVKPAEVRAYYEKEKAKRYSLAASRDYRQILNEDKSKVEAAKRMLEADPSPKTWKRAAEEYSSGSSRFIGGLRRLVTEESVEEPLRAAIFDSAIGELTGPVLYEGDYTLIEPIRSNPARSTPLVAMRGYITRDLNHLRRARFYREYFDSTMKKWVSRTSCGVEYLYDQCVNFTTPN